MIINIGNEDLNYSKGLEIINNNENDIEAIIVEAGLPEGNILNFLNEINKKELLTKTIVKDDMRLACYKNINKDYKIFNIVSKNIKEEDLEVQINLIKKSNNEDIENHIYAQISNILKRLGIAPDKNGFHYLRKAIYESYKNPNLLTSITKGIYPLISKEFNKNEACIERSMRSAIETGWTRGDYEYSNQLFMNCVDYDKSKPTNGEFISIIVDKLLFNS